ncbi:MAG: hypothetical protein JWR25_461 [Noviherbaspirillum sp.]|nr:hypothetical protein [Noviherbaspirillum sp.]
MEPNQSSATPGNGMATQAAPVSTTSVSPVGAPQGLGSQSADRPSGSSASSATAAASKSTSSEAKRTAQKSAATLRSELSNLKNDLDSLVTRAPSLSDEELSQAHARLMQQFSSLRFAAKGIADQAGRQLNRSVETTTKYVKQKPMQSVAVAVGTGVLLGMLLKRR